MGEMISKNKLLKSAMTIALFFCAKNVEPKHQFSVNL
jgi:hypothetical protein